MEIKNLWPIGSLSRKLLGSNDLSFTNPIDTLMQSFRMPLVCRFVYMNPFGNCVVNAAFNEIINSEGVIILFLV